MQNVECRIENKNVNNIRVYGYENKDNKEIKIDDCFNNFIYVVLS